MARNDDELDVEQDTGEKENSKSSDVVEESSGSKIVTILIVILIILIWLGAFALAIKLDVGGLGSNVLAPVLKDVPLINRILPSGSANAERKEYATLDEALKRIKELELQLESQSSSKGVDSNYIAELEAEVNRLKVFEKEQEKFAEEKKKFDEEVVYADAAPDITEYQKYYENMNPDNAAEIYRQVIEQVQYNKEVTEQAERYANMEPAAAAAILDTMTSADLDMVCAILKNMKTEASALILQELDANVAAKITKRMLADE
ncbi:MAG: hypothetical protein HFJ09_08265 [Lachnospiraceae bacterium]|nr:hypothetical protein [Lachnospiraceae bacterium]